MSPNKLIVITINVFSCMLMGHTVYASFEEEGRRLEISDVERTEEVTCGRSSGEVTRGGLTRGVLTSGDLRCPADLTIQHLMCLFSWVA